MPFNLGPGELLLLALVALLFFGPKKLPELGKAIGESCGAFKKALNDVATAASSDVPNNPNDPAQVPLTIDNSQSDSLSAPPAPQANNAAIQDKSDSQETAKA